jgi:hypothetical protein
MQPTEIEQRPMQAMVLSRQQASVAYRSNESPSLTPYVAYAARSSTAAPVSPKQLDAIANRANCFNTMGSLDGIYLELVSLCCMAWAPLYLVASNLST